MLLAFGIIVFLLFSAFFSGSEIAFVSANRLGVAVKKDQGSRRGRILANFFEKPDNFISTMLVGNNIALVAFTALMTKAMEPHIMPLLNNDLLSLLFYTLVTTAIVLIFGEFLPKTIFRMFANKLLYFFTYPLAFLKWCLAIPTYFMTALSNFLLKYVVRVPIEGAEIALTRLDLEDYIDKSIADENNANIDKEILTNALGLQNMKVREAMIPRTEIIAIDIESSIDDLVKTIQDSNHSRILIIDGDIENIEGYIHHQQIFNNPTSIKKMMLTIPYVPETMNIKDLMLQFINNETNIACVVDEYGSTAGIITLEDILEEIFGEIDDEHDVEEFIDDQISENEYVFSGRLEVDFINDKYNLGLPEGEYQTLSGYIVMTSGNIPETGAIIEMDNFKFILEMVSDTKIETVRLIKKEMEESESLE